MIAEKFIKQTLEFSNKTKLKYNLIGIYESLSNLYEKKKIIMMHYNITKK
jgi:hypothetical protein